MDVRTDDRTVSLLPRQPDFPSIHRYLWRHERQRVGPIHWSAYLSDLSRGLGLLSLCFDWQYISSSALAIPLQAQLSNFIGYLLCVVVFCGVWFGNIWQAQTFPFVSFPHRSDWSANNGVPSQLSQTLFFENGTVYDQLLILDSNFEVDYNAVAGTLLRFRISMSAAQFP